MVKIRDYIGSDYDDIKLNLEEGNLFDVNDTRENLEAKIKRDPESIIVSETDNKVVGNVYVNEDGWAAFIWHLAVRKEYRNKGIGSLLMKEAEEKLRKRGYKEANIFVLENNNDVINYYKRRGYQEFGKCISMFKKL